ncbi:2-C-methyl-D-erythritol 2,4-cyclodiphosphate synthase [Savagea sp. SN6]|uniref:2-C-methyl-D-erythritol 2,4-cyclodiphosphate synthase n=1 Tax=Savagea serpentis TaxID=2785297 RepID=A0A8J7GAE5_9BACL|nr:2-C-methyl-D-erythritol 2,4-cyclodiphosphate synthase [Savagea serpentis]MBF4500940.1 2-C-methyl-D-erythritol 2,4-cyclodiphosphate synthase [Savagea serpentis]
MIRIGQGFDVHAFEEGRPLMIGGIEVPHERGLVGHSDADVVLHTITDAALGAIGKVDIGTHFPDTDMAFKDADSALLLEEVWKMVEAEGYHLGNVDCTILAQRPKMGPHIPKMRNRIAQLLHADESQVNIKASTTEKLGFVGREEGIASLAVILLIKK